MFRDRSYQFSAIRHLPIESHLNPGKYNFFYITLTCPPVVSASPEKGYRPNWDILTVSFVGVVGEGGIWTMVESSTKQYPTSHIYSWEMHHLEAAS